MLSGFGFLRILWAPINLKFAHIYPFSSFGPFSWLLILFKQFEVAFGEKSIYTDDHTVVWGCGDMTLFISTDPCVSNLQQYTVEKSPKSATSVSVQQMIRHCSDDLWLWPLFISTDQLIYVQAIYSNTQWRKVQKPVLKCTADDQALC